MSTHNLHDFLEFARVQGDVDPALFASIVFVVEVGTVFDLGEQLTSGSHLDAQDFVRAAIAVLRAAVELNPDDARVLRWFRYERLSTFANMTPAETIAAGHSRALLEYVQSLHAGWTG